MDPPTLPPSLLPNLSSQIDTLTSTLHPLLTTPLSTTTSTLPLLSRAKLHIHLAYTIESLLYSSLLLSGQNPKEHAIFAELARLKGYFQKVKEIEERGLKGEGGEKEKEEARMRLDKDAAGRFVRAGLAGNEQFDRDREEREKGIRERTKRKADALAEKEKQRKHIKFDQEEESRRMAALPKEKRGEADDEDEDEDEDDEDEQDHDQNEEMQDAINAAYDESKPFSFNRPRWLDPSRPINRERERWRRAQRAGEASISIVAGEEEVLIPAKQQQGAPRTPGETFKALLEGPLKKGGKEDGKGKGKGKGKGRGRGEGKGKGK